MRIIWETFFRKLWLNDYFNEGLLHGIVNNFMYQSMITLNYKKGDRFELDNWRQINLINIDHEIFVRAIANRMNDAMNKLNEIEQTPYKVNIYIEQLWT